MKISVDRESLQYLLDRAKQNNAVEKWADMALEYIDGLLEEIDKLTKEKSEKAEKNKRKCPDCGKAVERGCDDCGTVFGRGVGDI